MKIFLILLFLFVYSNSEGQTVSGIWHNTDKNRYLEFKNDSCILINKLYGINDSVGRYYTEAMKVRIDASSIKFWHYYYTTGIRFWRLRDNCIYNIETISDSTLVINPRTKKSKMSAFYLDLIGDSVITLKRVTKKWEKK